MNPQKNFFHCFGCGAGGDVIAFIRRIENLDYVSAVKLLADRAGLTVPNSSFDDSASKLRMRVLEANRTAARFYHDNLYGENGAMALSYFRKRQLMDKTIRCFGLGYSIKSRVSLVTHLKENGFSDDEIVAANLGFIGRNDKLIDRFSNRVMFPIIDTRGNVLGFGGRQLEDYGPKYLNTSDTVAFKKSYNLFSLNFAKNTKEDYFILAEGYMDVIALFQAGFQNAIATLGTSLTYEQAKIIGRYKKEVVISYDSDNAGQKATNRAIPILRAEGLNVRVINMGDKKDPDEYIKAYGKDGAAKYRHLIEISAKDIDYKLEMLKLKFDLDGNSGRVEYLTNAAKLLAELDNDIEKDVYAGKLAQEINVDKFSILRQTKVFEDKNKKRKQYKKTIRREKNQEHSATYNKENLRSVNAEKALIAYLINTQEVNDKIYSQITENSFTDDLFKKIYLKIIDKSSNNLSFDLTDLLVGLTESEIDKLTACVSKSIYDKDTLENAIIYAEIINEEYEKRMITQDKDLDKDMIDSYFENLRKKKQ